MRGKITDKSREMLVRLSGIVRYGLVAAVAFGSVVAYGQDVASSGGKKLTTIVIDPGHGGKDPGAIGSKFREKNVVLNVSLKLGKMLNDSIPDLKVAYTRDDDTFVPLNERAEFAIKNSADIFVSIHANSSKNKTVYGSETFLLGQHRSKENLEVAQKENSVITLEEDYTSKYEGFDPSQPESVITFAGMQSDYINKSIDMAVLVQKGFESKGRADRGVKQAGFLVLRQVPMPSVLIELGFISNRAEEAYMASDTGSVALAGAIYGAIKSFKEEYDGRVAVMRHEEKKPKVELWPEGVNFRVQVAAASKAQVIDTLGYGPQSREVVKGVTRYMVGICKSVDEVEKVKDGLKEKYPDCFVVAYDGKERISVRAAKKRLKK